MSIETKATIERIRDAFNEKKMDIAEVINEFTEIVYRQDTEIDTLRKIVNEMKLLYFKSGMVENSFSYHLDALKSIFEKLI